MNFLTGGRKGSDTSPPAQEQVGVAAEPLETAKLSIDVLRKAAMQKLAQDMEQW